MSELISRLKEIIEKYNAGCYNETCNPFESCTDCVLKQIREVIESQPPADQWIPVTYRETTEEERECGIEWKYILDCPLPDNDTEILVCTKAGSVWTDTFFNDDGCYLDGGYDLTEIAAWMPLPKPYKGGNKL